MQQAEAKPVYNPALRNLQVILISGIKKKNVRHFYLEADISLKAYNIQDNSLCH
jgi:hypothetical protein